SWNAAPRMGVILLRRFTGSPAGDVRFLKFNRFGIERIAPRGNGLLTLTGLRIRGHSDNRDVSSSRVFLEGPHGFPAIHDWHFEVHQSYVRVLGHGQLAALLAVLSREDLEIAAPLKARLEHVEVIVIVFDI